MIQRNIDRNQSDDRDELAKDSDSPARGQRMHVSERSSTRIWPRILVNGVTTFALACAAAYTSTRSTDKAVGMTAWIAVAIVGTASAIASARSDNAD